jgi:protein-disulfide isomerase
MADSQTNAGGGWAASVSGIIAALILGGSVVYGSSLVSNAVMETAERLEGMRVAMGEMKDAMGQAPTARAAAPAPSRGPDPNRRYEIAVNGAPVRGAEKAMVTIIEFSDFQCPFCGRVSPTLDQVIDEYGEQVQIAFKHLPLHFHAKAPAAHAASVAADKQGKFWEMHDKIFENQAQMSEAKYVEWAGELGLDVERFKRDVASAEVKKIIEDDKQEAAKLGVTGTPSFFINGRFLSGAQPYSAFKAAIERELNS